MQSLTFTIIKPDAVKAGYIGHILKEIADNGFTIRQLRMELLTLVQAQHFYKEHEGRPYFEPLTTFMSSGAIVVAVLSAEDAVEKYRALMGATKTADRKPGTLRFRYGTSLMYNALHGSDSDDSARREIDFFFKEYGLL